jgi:hypothetical protein
MNNIGATGDEGKRETNGKTQTNNVRMKGMEANVNESKIDKNKGNSDGTHGGRAEKRKNE